jgi:hypothetical protein
MKIESITKREVHFVETDDSVSSFYTRYSSDMWTVGMAESDEPVYNCEEIEKLFQEHKVTHEV